MIGAFIPWSDHVNSPGWIIEENGCHTWIGAVANGGYGVVQVKGRKQYVTRLRYEQEIGSIPSGLVLDHVICDRGKQGCCNPRHCKPVTIAENIMRGSSLPAQNARKTHCHRGHSLTGDNLSPHTLHTRGRRVCKRCQKLDDDARSEARKQKYWAAKV